MMKKLIFAMIVLAIPFTANAQRNGLFGKKSVVNAGQDMSAYMQGAVPEVDGKVVFSQTFALNGKTEAQAYAALAQWSSMRYMANTENGLWNEPGYYRNMDNAVVREADKSNGILVCQADEEQVFSNRTLAKDYCRMNYILTLKVEKGSVVATMSTISYVYNLTETPERIAAEDWITDSEAFNKKGTKMLKSCAKFRIKTIDVKNQLFKEIGETLAK